LLNETHSGADNWHRCGNQPCCEYDTKEYWRHGLPLVSSIAFDPET
jgi:hypothetical protein